MLKDVGSLVSQYGHQPEIMNNRTMCQKRELTSEIRCLKNISSLVSQCSFRPKIMSNRKICRKREQGVRCLKDMGSDVL